MRKYRLVAKKGEGTFSEVLKAQNVKDGRYHAIKCMKNRFDSIDQVNNLREIQALRRLSPHEHIISLEEVLYDQPTGRLALVFELMDANLYELIKGRRHYLNPQLIKSYMWQLMKSLDHMHRKGIFHRDIKPENILIESTGEIGKGLKLADFGSCRGIYSKQPYTEYISTRWYRAPECLLTDGYYGPEMDLWGAGCVMFEITSLYPLFPGSNEIDQVNRIHKVVGTPSAECLAKFKAKGASHINFDFPPQKGIGIQQLVQHATADSLDLMVKLLKYDASERITAREAMRHPFFKDVREAEMKQQGEKPQAATMPAAQVQPQGQQLHVQQMPAAPAGGQFGQPAAGDAKAAYGLSSGAKALPGISNAQGVLDSVQYNSKGLGVGLSNAAAAAAAADSQPHQPLLLMQKQPSNNKGAAVSAAGSLPPIMPTGHSMGLTAQGKYPDPKSVRTMAPTNNSQKRRKKYRMNYAQQQNSESVMRAYGVPKYFGASGEAKQSDSYAARPDPSKMLIAPSAGAGMGGPSLGQFQARSYLPQPKKY